MRRALAAALTAVALLTATLAWSGWVFATVSTTARTRAMVTAALDDPAARDELARDLSTALAGPASDAVTGAAADGTVYQVDPGNTILQAVVTTALANDGFRQALADAAVTAETDAAGAGTNPIVVPASVVSAVVHDYVTTVDPTVTSAIPAITGSVTIPVAAVPALAKTRAAARTWPAPLALLAVGLLVVAALAARPRLVLRRAALWSLAAGASWLVLPAAVRWSAHRWFPSHAGTVTAAVRAAFAGIPRPVIALLAAGVAGLIASVPWRRRGSKQILSLPGGMAEGAAA